MKNLSAYIPCYNNASTVGRAIHSIQVQTIAPEEIIVVDDGSTDGSAQVAEQAGAKVVILEKNSGRGMARHQAMNLCRGEFVLSLDGNKMLGEDFVERSMPWFAKPSVAAVCGRPEISLPKSCTGRWLNRHVFRSETLLTVSCKAPLITAGAIVRRAAVLEAGNYRESLRHSEDLELGQRLLSEDAEVIFDPGLAVSYIGPADLSDVLEKYWRWNCGASESTSWQAYLRQVNYTFKVLMREDLQKSDLPAALISMLSPHYQFWRSWWRERSRQRNQAQ